jgi:hypothetical protein
MRVVGILICACLLGVLVATPPASPAQQPAAATRFLPPDQVTPPYMEPPYLFDGG